MSATVSPPHEDSAGMPYEPFRAGIYLIHTHTWVDLDEITDVRFSGREAVIWLTNGRYVLAQGDDVAALRKTLGIAE